jgi:hypothetical protein
MDARTSSAMTCVVRCLTALLRLLILRVAFDVMGDGTLVLGRLARDLITTVETAGASSSDH